MLGTLCFLAAEGMFFLGLTFVALSIRGNSLAWPPESARALSPVLPLANTLVLLVSSATLHLGVRAIRKGERRILATWVSLTTLQALVFLGGQVALFNSLGGWQPWDGYTALFDTVVILHGIHVIAGIGLLGVVLVRALRGHFDQDRHLVVVATELYWHFVTAAWLVLFTVLLAA